MMLPGDSGDFEPELLLAPLAQEPDRPLPEPPRPSAPPVTPEGTAPKTPEGGTPAPEGETFQGEPIDFSKMLEEKWPQMDQQSKDRLRETIKTPEAYRGVISANDTYHRLYESDLVVDALLTNQGLSDIEYLRNKVVQYNPMSTSSQISEAMKAYMAEDNSGLSEEMKTKVAGMKSQDDQSLQIRSNEIWEEANRQSQDVVQYVQRLTGHIDTFTPQVTISVGGEEVKVDAPLSKRARYELNRFIHTNGASDAIGGAPTKGEKGHENLADSAMWLNPKSREELISAIVKATEEKVKNANKR